MKKRNKFCKLERLPFIH